MMQNRFFFLHPRFKGPTLHSGGTKFFSEGVKLNIKIKEKKLSNDKISN